MNRATPEPSSASQPGHRALRDHYDAIVIGASAGGVDVLLQVLPTLPAWQRCVVLIVLHLPRTRDSLLPAILAQRGQRQVREARDKETPQPGMIYVAPPDYHLLVETGPVLALSADEPLHFSRPAIDVLFESAADVYAGRLLGIVLSGGSIDGAEGLAQIAAAGGDTLIQAPASAAMRTMPEAALARCPQALTLSPAELAQRLAALH